MPIQRCKIKGKLGYKWGASGKCYVGYGALAKAERQAQAIYSSGYTGNSFCPTGPGGGIDPTCSPGESQVGSGNPSDDALKGIKRMTAGSNLVGTTLAPQHQAAVEEFVRGLPAIDGDAYRLMNISNEKLFDDYIDGGKPIKIRSLQSWTQDRSRVYGYGTGGDKVLLTISGKSAGLRDISKWSTYPVEKEAVSPQGMSLRIVEKTYHKALGWQLKVELIPTTNTQRKKRKPNPLKSDPSRTATLRRRFETEMRRRFNLLKRDVRDLLVKDDAFGLRDVMNSFCPNGPGGGIDPSCSPGESSAISKEYAGKEHIKQLDRRVRALASGSKLTVVDRLDRPFDKGEVNLETGEIKITKLTADEAERFFEGDRDEYAIQAVLVPIHEAMHASGSVTEKSRIMQVEAIEEATAEVVAREYMAKRFGLRQKVIPNKSSHHYGTYQRVVQAGVQSLVKETGTSFEQAATKFREASWLWRVRSKTDDYRTALFGFIEDLGLDQQSGLRVAGSMSDAYHGRKTHNLLSDAEAVANERFIFATTHEQVLAFQKWLAQQLQYRILGMTAKQVERMWWEQYVQAGYKQGAGRAFQETRKIAKSSDMLSWYGGTQDDFLRSSFGRPVAVEKVQLLAGRTYTDLKGVTEQMATQLSRTLTDGLVRGQNPRDIAKTIVDDIDGMSEKRAMVIARTEIIRAHAEGNLDAMEMLGVEDVGVEVEWSTAGDGRVCPLCQPLEGVVMKIEEMRGLVPRHPQCRCSPVPAGVGEKGKVRVDWQKEEIGQTKTKKGIDRAIDDSIDAEDRDRDTTKWVGADAGISKARPQSILNQGEASLLGVVFDKLDDVADRIIDRIDSLGATANAFCPTGEGGGIDPSCSPGESSDTAQRFIESVTVSSRLTPSTVSQETREALRGTVTAGDYQVFRGVGVMKFRVSDDEWQQLSRLNVGDDAPPWLTGRRIEKEARPFSSYTKSEGVAKRYREGNVEVVLSGTVPNASVVADLTRLKKLPEIDKDTVKYGTREKEVIVEGQVPMKIHSVKWNSKRPKAIVNAFCPTGEGGGVDPTCPSGTAGHVITQDSAATIEKNWSGGWHGDRYDYAARALQTGGKCEVLRDKGEVVSVAMIPGVYPRDPKWKYLHLEYLATKRPGYGKKMMAHVCAQAAKHNVGVELGAAPGAVEFYKAIGMKEQKRYPGENLVPFRFTARQAKAFAAKHGATENVSASSLEPEDGIFTIPEGKKVQRSRKGTANVFCPTGVGGGVDPTCSPGGAGASGVKTGFVPHDIQKKLTKEERKEYTTLAKERRDLNLKVKDSTATDEDRSRLQTVTERLSQMRQLGKSRPGPEPVAPTKPPSTNPPPTLTKVTPAKGHSKVLDQLAADKDLDAVIEKIKKDSGQESRSYDDLVSRVEDLTQKHENAPHGATRLMIYGKLSDALRQVHDHEMLMGSAVREALKLQPEDRNLTTDIERASVSRQIDESYNSSKKVASVTSPLPNLDGRISSVSSFVSEIVHKDAMEGASSYLKPNVQVHVSPVDKVRGYHTDGFGMVIGMASETRTIAHEYGHDLEYKLPGVRLACQKFREERIAKSGKPDVSLREKFPDHNYAASETGNDDDFGKAFGPGESPSSPYYVGKYYPSGHTEVLSMGMQLLHESPGRFMTKDPEYFKFTVACLRGNFNPNVKPKAAKAPPPPSTKVVPPSDVKIPLAPKITSRSNQGVQKRLDQIYALAAKNDIDALRAIKTSPDAKQTYSRMVHRYKVEVLKSLGIEGAQQ